MVHIIEDLDKATEEELRVAIADNSKEVSNIRSKIDHFLGLSIATKSENELQGEEPEPEVVSTQDDAELKREAQLFMKQIRCLPLNNKEQFTDYLNNLIMLINYPDVERVLARVCAEYNKEIFSNMEMLQNMRDVSTSEEFEEFEEEVQRDTQMRHRVSDALIQIVHSKHAMAAYQYTKLANK